MNSWQEKLESVVEFKHLGSCIRECEFPVPFLEYMKSSILGNQEGKWKYGVTPGTFGQVSLFRILLNPKAVLWRLNWALINLQDTQRKQWYPDCGRISVSCFGMPVKKRRKIHFQSESKWESYR